MSGKYELAGLAVALVVLVGTVSASGVLAIDDDHQLARDAAVAEYESTGTASTSLVRVDMSVTVAESHEAVGLEGAGYTDFDTTYVRLEYREELSRTVRIYLPDEYFRPRPKDGLEAVESDNTASLETVDGRNYTAVRVSFSGPETAVFELSKQAGLVFDGRGEVKDLVSNRTGVELPSIQSSGQWSYVDSTALSANTTVALETTDQELTLQYDADPSVNSSSWIAVPDCGGASAPVCRFTREGSNETVHLLSRSTETPEVRYKHGNDPLAGLKSSIADARRAAANALDGLGDLLNFADYAP
ncbi:hypothetical protein [Halosimplex pelagicum]|uniref:Uncharacterized protein n=1 Tax=Halosimplex pelagicum TaxID=869886 RepID=A0A7D5PFL3_9EURY|nr:hypothetical protein [Halosimplex pelagicum]QLH83400.1 hypothetical protein HZS54_17955 [Halosimplex pelagicum]